LRQAQRASEKSAQRKIVEINVYGVFPGAVIGAMRVVDQHIGTILTNCWVTVITYAFSIFLVALLAIYIIWKTKRIESEIAAQTLTAQTLKLQFKHMVASVAILYCICLLPNLVLDVATLMESDYLSKMIHKDQSNPWLIVMMAGSFGDILSGSLNLLLFCALSSKFRATFLSLLTFNNCKFRHRQKGDKVCSS
jgi:hypothetical protein